MIGGVDDHLIVGLAAILGPGELTEVTVPFLAIMVGSAFLAGVFSVTGQRINRIEGAVLLVFFVTYAVFAFI